MKVDAHQHFWKFNDQDFGWIDDEMAVLRRDFTPDDLAAELSGSGYRASIAVQAAQTLQETDFLLGIARAHPFVAGVVGWFDLQSDRLPDVLVSFADDPLLVGARHIVQAERPGFMVQPAFVDGVRCLARFGLTYDLLIREWQMDEADEFLSMVEDVPVVLDHMAKPDLRGQAWEPWAGNIRRLARHPNLRCKISGLSFEAHWQSWSVELLRPYVEHVLECFGPERCMVGSDWPVSLVAGDYYRTMSALEQCLDSLSGEERKLVTGGNALNFYGIGTPGEAASM